MDPAIHVWHSSPDLIDSKSPNIIPLIQNSKNFEYNGQRALPNLESHLAVCNNQTRLVFLTCREPEERQC